MRWQSGVNSELMYHFILKSSGSGHKKTMVFLQPKSKAKKKVQKIKTM